MNTKMTLQMDEMLAKLAQVQDTQHNKLVFQVIDVFIYCIQGDR